MDNDAILRSNLAKLPEHAFVDNPVVAPETGERQYATATTSVIAITRGEEGFKPFPTRQTADALNAQFNVSPAQREAMLCGSLFGFHVPGADPDLYGKPNETSGNTNDSRDAAEIAAAPRQ